ncbi:transcription factor 12-like isoform X4 [Ruditapes philippinarum]|uniref:transcription factor 12-like isoform X4 n=1 Tax=Ruditapes philippinarum TaxID=129788 RepID=UPI00295B19B7|nr:transcription factor 12-like isoform X4 [Ruditapes philippinarum]
MDTRFPGPRGPYPNFHDRVVYANNSAGNGPYQRFGERMHIQPDKELNDLLDFSAFNDPYHKMFSPPVSAGMKGPVQQGGGNMEMYNAYKQGEEVGSSWSQSHQGHQGQPPGYNESRMFSDNQNFNNGHPDNMHPFVNNNDIINKNSDLPYRSFNRDSMTPQNMMGNTSNIPMSPEQLSPRKQMSPYYQNYKQTPMDESIRGRRGSGQSNTKRPKGSVYSPGPDDYGQESPGRSYTSPKPMYPGDNYFMEGPPQGSSIPWSNGGSTSTYPASMLPGNFTQSSSHNNLHPHEMGYPHPVSPNQDLLNSGLPPMSTFRGQPIPPSSATYTNSSSSVTTGNQGQGSSQTGDALGKALASIYSTDHTSSSYGSNPSTPVSSPSPMTGSSSQWQRPSQTSSTSPQFEGPLHSLQNVTMELKERQVVYPALRGNGGRMEERLDDAIHVLRNHAEGQMPAHSGMPGHMMSSSHSNGIMGNMGYNNMIGHGGHVESPHMGGPPPLTDSGSQGMSSSTSHESQKSLKKAPVEHKEIVKAEKPEDTKSEASNESKASISTPVTEKSKLAPPPSKRSRKQQSQDEGPRSAGGLQGASNDDEGSGDEDESPETKAERERLRRQANNARESSTDKEEKDRYRRQANNDRERVRVRDINEAFKELGSMVTMHCGTTQPLTKLMVLQQAVNVITTLESQVRERNLNPKAACLKRREDEKSDDIPGRPMNVNAEDLQQGSMGPKCPPDVNKQGGWW